MKKVWKWLIKKLPSFCLWTASTFLGAVIGFFVSYYLTKLFGG